MKVSCIMPCSRPDDLPRAIEVFLSQDYEDKELCIVLHGDDHESKRKTIENKTFNIRFAAHYGSQSIGVKRNRACDMSVGEIIINFDSDDYFTPGFITRSVNHLLNCGADITGLSSAYFYRPHTDMWLYEYKGNQPYVIGSGMCYYKRVWEKKQFPDKSSGEDLDFQANAGRIMPHDYKDGFLAMIHGNNTASHKQIHAMKKVDPAIAKQILGESYYLYKSA